MSTPQRMNSGILFKNTRRETERHPDYTGAINLNGTEFSLSAWVKQGARGKFMSLSVTPKTGADATSRAKSPDQFDDAAGF